MSASDNLIIDIGDVAELLRRTRETNALAPAVIVARREAEALDDAGWLVTVDVLRDAFLAGLIGMDEPSARDEAEDEDAFQRWLSSTYQEDAR